MGISKRLPNITLCLVIDSEFQGQLVKKVQVMCSNPVRA
jgi:hypothetical protein